MAIATVITTTNILESDGQGFAASQDVSLRVTTGAYETGHVSPGFIYKMRAWDTVANAYIFWTSYGDATTPPPTLNPVTGKTAIQMNRPRTV